MWFTNGWQDQSNFDRRFSFCSCSATEKKAVLVLFRKELTQLSFPLHCNYSLCNSVQHMQFFSCTAAQARDYCSYVAKVLNAVCTVTAVFILHVINVENMRSSASTGAQTIDPEISSQTRSIAAVSVSVMKDNRYSLSPMVYLYI